MRQWTFIHLAAIVAIMLLFLPPVVPVEAQEPKDPWFAEVGEPTLIKLYFIRNGQLAVVHRVIPMPEGKAIARATTWNLLAGPTTEEQGFGVETAIPLDTDLVDIQIDNDTETLTVTLGDEFLREPTADFGDDVPLRFAQVVYTLTQFRNVSGAVLFVDDEGEIVLDGWGVANLGRRFDRDRLTGNRGQVFFDNPAIGDAIGSRLPLTGYADRYLDAFTVGVYDLAGNELGFREVFTQNGRTMDTFGVELRLNLRIAESDLVLLVVDQLDPPGDDRRASHLVALPLWLA